MRIQNILISLGLCFTISFAARRKSCQGYMGPPNELYFNHSMLDYTGQAPQIEERYLLKMYKNMLDYEQLISEEAPSDWDIWEDLEGSDEQAVWIFYGTAGRALAYLNYHHAMEKMNQSYTNQYGLLKAKEYIDKAAQNMTIDTKFIGFLKGHTGIYSVASVIYHLLGDEATAETYYTYVIDQFKNLSKANGMGYDQGVSGLLFCAEFLKAYFGRDIVSNDLIVEAGKLIMEVGMDYAFDNGTMKWPDQSFTEAQWLGQGMGISGILYRLLKIPELFENQTYVDHIQLTLEFLVIMQSDEGQMLDYETSTMPGMHLKVQWCHGAPGLIPVFLEAAKVFKNETYLYRAKLAARYVWKYGIVKKGLALCHGTLGNAYMIHYIWKATNDNEFLYYFLSFHKYALDEPTLTDVDKMVSYDCSAYSAYIDSVGSAMASYADFLYQYENGDLQKMGMPGWGKPNFAEKKSHDELIFLS